MKQIYLFPGTLAASREPAEITTILGSCVAIALYDRELHLGGLNHYLLPEAQSSDPRSARYGNCALPLLLQALEAFGSRPRTLLAKVYGGANVLLNVTIGEGIGRLNVQLALNLLAELKIPVIEQNTGGTLGRRIVLNTGNFEVRHEFPSERNHGSAA